MPWFDYEAADGDGGIRRAGIEADSLREAAERLRGEGLEILRLSRADPDPAPVPPGTADAFALFNRSLARMAGAGIPLPEAVADLSRGLRRGALRRALEGVEAALRDGKRLSDAVETQGDAFPAHYRALVRAGEASGNLPGVLLSCAEGIEVVHRARRAILAATAYPCVILGCAAILVAYMLAVMKPRYEEFLRDSGGEPAPAGAGAEKTLLVAAAAAAGVAALYLRHARRTPAGERLLLRVPVFGRVLGLLAVSRFLGALSVLLKAKTALPDALPAALAASGSPLLLAAAGPARARAAEGAPIGEALAGTGLVPGEIVSHLGLAERTGSLPESAGELFGLAAERARAAADALHVVLQPAAVALAGVAVGAIYLHIAIPYIRLLDLLAAGAG